MIVKCDVLVVGAGCAGSVAALKLGKEGFNVVLIERESKVGGHTEPKFDISEDSGLGGILGELNLPYSEKTGRSSWFSRDYSFTLESKVSDLYFKRGPLSDCFEVQVVKKAVDSGVQLFLGSELSNFKINGTSIDSVKLSSKNDDVTLEPKVVIAADGFNSGMAGKMGLHVLRDTAEIVGYGIMGLNFNMPPAETHIFFDREYAPGGYFYIGKTRKGEGVACLVAEASMLNGPIESYYQKFTQQNNKLGEILDGSKIINKFQGMSKAGIMQRRVRGNVLLAGDAARTLDPLLGYGMKNAIKSGYAAAETAITYLNKEVNTLSIYEKKIEKTTTQTKKDTNLRKIFNKLNNQDLNTIVKILADLQKDGINLDTLGDKNSVTKLKHVIKNLPLITRIGLKAIIPIIS